MDTLPEKKRNNELDAFFFCIDGFLKKFGWWLCTDVLYIWIMKIISIFPFDSTSYQRLVHNPMPSSTAMDHVVFMPISTHVSVVLYQYKKNHLNFIQPSQQKAGLLT